MAQRYSSFPAHQSALQMPVRVQSDAHLPANCYTLGRFGVPTEGIVMSMNRGPDEFQPWTSHILVGGYRIHRDSRDGCVFHKNADGVTAIVRRAVPHYVEPLGKSPFYTLKSQEKEKPSTTLVKVSTVLTFAKSAIHMNGQELRLFAGVSGGTMIGRDGYEALVELMEGETMSVFYEDGAVRTFRRQGVMLEERHLGTQEMLTARIQNAWERLEFAEAIGDNEKRVRMMNGILSGMADLIHLTTRFNQRGLGQEMRMELITEFFCNLTPEAMELIHRKVTAVLHQVDPALLSALRTGGSSEKDTLPEGVADISDARDTRDRAKREAEREARRLERLAAQPKKGPGGQKQKQTTNPKKLAKLARKFAHRK